MILYFLVSFIHPLLLHSLFLSLPVISCIFISIVSYFFFIFYIFFFIGFSFSCLCFLNAIVLGLDAKFGLIIIYFTLIVSLIAKMYIFIENAIFFLNRTQNPFLLNLRNVMKFSSKTYDYDCWVSHSALTLAFMNYVRLERIITITQIVI